MGDAQDVDMLEDTKAFISSTFKKENLTMAGETDTEEGGAKCEHDSKRLKKSQMPLIADDQHQTDIHSVASNANPGELNCDLFVTPMEGLETNVGTNTTKLLIVDEETSELEAPSNDSVVQHICQHCGFTSSKRYLLTRHMRCHSDNRPHPCKLCERRFKTVKALQNHINTHTQTKPYPCKECDSAFTTSGELVRHVRYKHTHEKPHKCTKCNYACVELSKLKRHIRCHTGETSFLHECPSCRYTSPDMYRLKVHLRTHTGEKPYACDICPARFSQSGSLKIHLRIHSQNKPVDRCEYCPLTRRCKSKLKMPLIANDQHQTCIHPIVASDANPGELNYDSFVTSMEGLLETKAGTNATKLLTVDEETSVCETPSDDSIVKHICQYCGITDSKSNLLVLHMGCHSDERPHTCNLCGHQFKTARALQNHINTHTQTKPYPCKECDSAFTTSGELVRHVRYKHTHEKPYKCTKCNYASAELGKLKRHTRCHTGERGFLHECPLCTYKSPDTHRLKAHVRTHTGEKPYACDICSARFTQSYSLKTHLQIHNGNKPVYKCEYCPSVLGTKGSLKIHTQKMHSSDQMLTCKQCGEVFKDRYSYKVHSKTHDEKKAFKCTDCSFVTSSLRQFETHVVTHGNKDFYQCKECAESFSHKQLLTQHINSCHESKHVTLVSKPTDVEFAECDKEFCYHENLVQHAAIHAPDASSEKRKEAIQIGRPKEPGEPKDGEEEELSNEENFENDQMPLIADDQHQTCTRPVVASNANPGELNYDSFVIPMAGLLETKAGTNATKLLTIGEETSVSETPSDDSVVKHVCQYCGFITSKSYLLARHMRCHSDESPYPCNLCKRRFKTASALRNHINTHTQTKPHHCKECDSAFTTSGELLRHVRYKHTHEKPYKCTKCNYASVELSKLRRHIRCHTGESSFLHECPHCTYKSRDAPRLKVHIRTHTGEKPYACDMCSARFTQSHNLKIHLRIHNGNKPVYKCEYCPSSLGSKSSLKTHTQQTHCSDQILMCKQCGEEFKDRYSYKMHRKTHYGEKTFNDTDCPFETTLIQKFKCTDCSFVTSSLRQFEAHVMTHGNKGLYQCKECAENFSYNQLLTQHINSCHESKHVTLSAAIHDPDASPEKKREAIQIGRPKKPGEAKGGEENELSNEENFENDQVC